MLLFFIWINLEPLFAVIPNGQEYVSGIGVVLFLGIANIINSTFCIATNILNFSKQYAFSLLFIVLLTASAILLNIWLIPHWSLTGSACATLFAYIIYFVPLLTFLWRRLGVSLFSKKQIWIVFFTLILFALNALWSWLISPLFSHLGSDLVPILIEALVRTLVFAVIAFIVIRRLHISPEVDALLNKLPIPKR